MKRLTGPLNVKLITEEFFPSYVGAEAIINEGQCMFWSYIAYKLYSGVELWSNEDHAFVKYNGKFYDSETPKGVDRWQELPCNSRGLAYGQIEKSHMQRLDRFKSYWLRHGRYGTMVWDRFDEHVQDYLKGLK